MAMSQSAVSELLEAFRTGEGVNLIHDAVQAALQDLIEAEATGRGSAATDPEAAEGHLLPEHP